MFSHVVVKTPLGQENPNFGATVKDFLNLDFRNNRFNTTGAGSSSTQMFQSSQNSNSQSHLDHTIIDQENIHFDWIKEEPIIDRLEKFSSKVLAIDDKARVGNIRTEIMNL